MSRRPRTTRTRKADLRPTPVEEPAPSIPEISEDGVTRAIRRAPRPAQEAPPAEPAVQQRALDPDDLLAIASMDPEELAALLEDSVQMPRHEVGAQVTGTVARVGKEDLFVDLGGKAEGILERAELPEARVGDQVTAFVFALDEGVVRLSTRLSGAAAAGHLEDAKASGIPVEGRITGRNSGGFEVRVGSVRAFCPVSRISRLPEVDLDVYVGQTLQFRVIEAGDKVVLDRRVLQEEEVAAKAEALWQRIAPGDSFRGVVRNVQPFGVFVDIGGVDGLVPKRELGWSGGDLSRFAVGQGIEVHVLEVDREARRLTLSAKDAGDDPWNLVGVEFVTGGVYEGVVVRVEPFGAFVELAEGLHGLVHVSKLAGSPPQQGDVLSVRLLSVDSERRRLELSPASSEELAAVGTTVKGTVSQVLKNGVVVQLEDGRTGWLAAREVELPGGIVLAQRFRVGKPVHARVLEDQGQRVTLTTRQETDAGESSWRHHAAKSRRESGGFGTLGDLLGNLRLPK